MLIYTRILDAKGEGKCHIMGGKKGKGSKFPPHLLCERKERSSLPEEKEWGPSGKRKG